MWLSLESSSPSSSSSPPSHNHHLVNRCCHDWDHEEFDKMLKLLWELKCTDCPSLCRRWWQGCDGNGGAYEDNGNESNGRNMKQGISNIHKQKARHCIREASDFLWFVFVTFVRIKIFNKRWRSVKVFLSSFFLYRRSRRRRSLTHV